MAEITAATAVGWAVSPVIKLVVNKILTFIETNYFQRSGMEDDMKKMNMILGEICSIMATVEKQRIVDPNEVQLVREVKDAVYNAEDLVDEFEYNLLEQKSEKQSRQQKNIRRVAPCSSRVFRAIIGNDNKKKIKEMNDNLDRAKRSAQTLLQLMNTKIFSNIKFPVQHSQTITSSIISDVIVGRENERELIINWLFEKAQGPPTIITIVGQGGIGKTTLAQMVFNDPRVTDHFDQSTWLSVSDDNFDKIELTKQMLKDVCENFTTTGASFNKLQKKLQTELASRKILLVLDDVWYVKDNNQKCSYVKSWLELLAPVKNAKAGSKIILTTRQELVVNSLVSFDSNRKISLSSLNDNDSWTLFELWAFDGSNQHNRQSLESIGIEIVNKLKGSPLAIRVVGTELRGYSNTKEWKGILNDNSFDKDDIMEILHRSYEHLPEHLKCCFAYCSLFPKDYYLKPDLLVHMWIAHGFIHPKEEDVGRSYFNELIGRSFIQVFKQGNKEHYVMHDLMNDLARHVSKGECYILKEGDTKKKLENLGSIRHLSVTYNAEAINLIKDIPNFEKLRSLLFLSYGWIPEKNLMNEVFIKLKNIRVLEIEWNTKNLSYVANCKHLRYLCFRNYTYDFKIEPDYFSKLHHLSVLFIRKDHWYSKSDSRPLSLPWSICHMNNLVLIDVSKSFLVDVDGCFQLHNLCKLRASVLLSVKNNGELDILRNFKHIKGMLNINGLENIASRDEAVKAQLSSKEHVTELYLCWSNSFSEVKINKQHEVLEAMGPHQSLEKLKIYGYPGYVFPSWLESNLLSRIKEIDLIECYELKKLPALGQLPQLKILRILFMIAVSRIGVEFHGNGTFPSLEEIRIRSMLSLEKWSLPCGVQAFPKLYKLEIINCPRFIGPKWDGFPSLKELIIQDCDAMKMKTQLKGCGCLPALTKLEIVNCKGIITLEGLHELLSLKMLIINGCPNLLYLPEMTFFYSLEMLQIENCPKLRSLPKKGLPVSLQTLFIRGTHDDLEKKIRSKNGKEWEKIAAICGCLCLIAKDGYQWETVKEGHPNDYEDNSLKSVDDYDYEDDSTFCASEW